MYQFDGAFLRQLINLNVNIRHPFRPSVCQLLDTECNLNSQASYAFCIGYIKNS